MSKETIELEKDHTHDKDFIASKQLIESMNIVDIAAALELMNKVTAIETFRMMPKNKAADVFAYLSREMQQHIVESITNPEIKSIINDLFVDDAVDFIEEMPASVVKRVLANAAKSQRELINQLLKYPRDSVGSIMTVEFVDLKASHTVAQAFDYIRKTGVDKETIYTCYVIDSSRKLLGIVSARALLLAEQTQKVSEIMKTSVISANTMDDKETLAPKFSKYDLLAMPVVDNEQRLVGIVTVDDAFDVQEQEATEDFEIMAAMSPSEEPYLKTSIRKLAKNRVFWLLLLMLSATFSGAVISSFEDALTALPVLVAFIPMLMNTGGCAGSQSAVLIIRGMALSEIKISDILAVWWKEIRIAVLCGAALVVVNFLRILIMNNDIIVALTVSLSLYVTVIMAKTVGSLLPMAAKQFRMDPAIMAAPVITTAVDAISLIIYFNLAKIIMGF
ncbi:MAG: magnesium transporter [Spirochaetes bacterium]|nr:magnesium transporter [Spirochaetota bacterium]